jgi:hypothetical protein
MKLIEENNTLVMSGPMESFDFGIDPTDPESMRVIVHILRNTLYTDKTLAIIREYSTNANDANMENGNGNRPILVTLPTQLSPELKIRDYGKGLTHDEVKDVYTKVGKSTKRNSNVFVGQLGIGCKSAFSYGDNFVVTSYCNGTKSIYNCLITGPCVPMSHTNMVDGEEDGIEITIPIKNADVNVIQNKAIHFFKYWDITPIFAGGIDDYKLEEIKKYKENKPVLSDVDWGIEGPVYSSENNAVAVMGNIPYDISWKVISEKLNLAGTVENSIFELLKRNKTTLRFKIGELEFAANREGLQYTQYTCDAINKKVKKIFRSVFNIIQTKINVATNIWEAYSIYNSVFNSYDLGITVEKRVAINGIQSLEPLFRTKANWNGLPLNGGKIDEMSSWDRKLGYKQGGHDYYANGVTIPRHSISQVYFWRRNKIKISESTYDTAIVPTQISRIVIDDTYGNRRIDVKKVVNYLMKSTTFSRIYLFTFENAKQKDQFISHYNLQTAPVFYVTSKIEEAKKWIKENRTETVSNKTLPVKYLTIDGDKPANKYSYTYEVKWERDNINLKDIKDTQYYIDTKDTEFITKEGKPSGNYSQLVESLTCINKTLGLNIKRIYGVNEKTRTAKWFVNAAKKQKWVNIFTKIQNTLDNMNCNKLVETNEFMKHYGVIGCINYKFTDTITPHLKFINGDMKKLINLMDKYYNTHRVVVNELNHWKFEYKTTKDHVMPNFEEAMRNAKKSYPMLFNYRNYHTYTDVTREDYFFNAELVEYINIIDELTEIKKSSLTSNKK